MSGNPERAQGTESGTVSQLVLTFNRDKFTLQIGGLTENLDEAIAMLDMATRELKMQIQGQRVGKVIGAPPGTLFNFRRSSGD